MSDCAIAGDGSSHACASSPGGPGAFNDWAPAEEALASGDVLRLDGTFELPSPIFFSVSGTSAKPTRITSFDPQNPAVLSASIGGMLYVRADYVEIDHLKLTNDAGTCLIPGQDSSNTHYWHWIHDNVFDTCRNALSMTYVENVEVRDNVFSNIGSNTDNQGHCIYPAQGAKHISVFRNRCTARADVFRSHCLHVYHDEPPGPAEDVDFHDNVCVGFTTGAGIYNGSSDVRIYGNTFVGQKDYAGLRCDYGGSTATFVNNIVVSMDAATMVTLNNTDGCNVDLHHNLYFDATGADPKFALDGSSEASSEWFTHDDQTSQVGDPLLADYANGDVHLAANSPAVDSGDDAFASSSDYYGGPRISGAAVDVGAAELFDGVAGGGGGSGGGGGAVGGAGGSLTGGSSGTGALGAVTGGAAHSGASARDSADEGGCGCRAAGPNASFSRWLSIVLIALGAKLRRRSR